MRVAVYPGSFDPVTLGHMDVIRRAALLFDELCVCVVANCEKKNPMFSDEEKVEMLRAAAADIPNVRVELWGGLVTDYAAEKGACVLVRGVRNGSEFDAEYQLSQIYGELRPGLDTVFLPASPRYSYISSTFAREMIKYHQDLTKYVPTSVVEIVKGWE